MGAALSIRARLDLQDAATVVGCDRSKVSRVESGERGIPVADQDGNLEEVRKLGIGPRLSEASSRSHRSNQARVRRSRSSW